MGSLFSEYLRSFGERYLDPFFVSPGASFEFFTVSPRRGFPLYIDASSENGAYFSNKSGPKLIWRKLKCVDNFQNDILKKRQAALDASPEMAGGTSRKADPIRPFPGSNTPAKVLKPPFSVFRTRLP